MKEADTAPLDGAPTLPGIDEAWQAHLFAITVNLNERGLFTWATWGQYFGPALKREYLEETLPLADGASVPHLNKDEGRVNRHYFLAWQAALEQLLSDLEIALPLDIGMRAQAQGCYPRVARAPMVFRALAQSPGKAGPE
jgi:nitrile hydratase accessory protein